MTDHEKKLLESEIESLKLIIEHEERGLEYVMGKLKEKQLLTNE